MSKLNGRREFLGVLPILALAALPALAVVERHGILVGEIIRLDAGAKSVVVKLADGTEKAFHFAGRSVVYGAREAAAGAQEGFHGLKVGSEVAVHYSERGAVATADEIDHIGKDGLKAIDGTVTHVDRGAKRITVKAANGAEETYQMTARAARDAGKDVAAGANKTAKATVYYTEEGGHKVVHFFKRAI